MYRTNYNEGDIVEIHTDYKNDVGFQGRAVLINRKSKGDSFYMDYEQMFVPQPFYDNTLNMESDPIQLQLNALSEYLDYYTYSNNKTVIDFVNTCIPHCNTDDHSYNKLFFLVKQWKKEYQGKTHYVNNIFKVETKYIVRYMQQRFTKDWSPTIFRSERWVVEFLPQRHPHTNDVLYNSPFRTARNIRVLLCLSPISKSKKKEISEYTTYNSKCIRDKDCIEPNDEELFIIEQYLNYVDITDDELQDPMILNSIDENEYYNE